LRDALVSARGSLKPYFAPDELGLGTIWTEKLGRALEEAEGFVFLFGRTIGRWQKLEYYDALQRKADNPALPLVSVVLEPAQAPSLLFFQSLQWTTASNLKDKELIGRILAGLDDEGDAPSAPWRHVNPFRGLHTLREEDAAFFYGREGLTADLLGALRTNAPQLLALVGNSGVGKSSLLEAGLFGALHSQRHPGKGKWPGDLKDSRAWLRLTFTPGEQPLYNLARCLLYDHIASGADRAREAAKWAKNFHDGLGLATLIDDIFDIYEKKHFTPPSRIVLNIDQGEELYTRATTLGPKDVARFSELIAAASQDDRLSILMSLRSDYYGHLQNDVPLFEASNRIDVPPIGLAGLRDVVREPVKTLGARYEDDVLPEKIATAAAEAPGGLPLLSYMLEDMWTRMQGEDGGQGVLEWAPQVIDLGAPLVSRAEDFRNVHKAREADLKRLFCMRLAHVPQQGEPVRRRALLSALKKNEARLAQELADRNHRLVHIGEEKDGEPFVEVAHEALIRDWPRLKGWLEEQKDFLIWRGELESAHSQWVEAKKTDDGLLRALPLKRARTWYDERKRDIDLKDRRFIEQSIARDEREAEDRVAQEAERAKLKAERVEQEAKQAKLQAALAEKEVDRARLKASEERERAQRLEAEAKSRNIRQWALIGLVLILFVASGVVGRMFLDAREANLELGHTKASLEKSNAELTSAVAEANENERKAVDQLRERQRSQSRFLARMSQDALPKKYLGNALSFALVATHPQDAEAPREQAAFSALSTAALEYAGAPVKPEVGFVGHTEPVTGAVFSTDETHVLTWSADKTARLWDAKSGDELAILRHEDQVTGAAFSTDETRVLTWSQDRTARLWDAKSGDELATLRHEGRVSGAVFSTDETRVLTWSQDATARLWDAKSGDELATLRHEDLVEGAVFSTDETRVLTWSEDKTARLWDAKSGDELATLRHEGRVSGAVFSTDETRVLTWSADRTARQWDAKSGDELATLRHESWVSGAVFSTDETRVLTWSLDGTVRLWDAKTGDELATLRHEGPVVGAVFSTDETRVLTWSEDMTAWLWDAKSGDELATLRHEGPVSGAVFSMDETRVLTWSLDGTVRLWDAKSGDELATLHHEGWVSGAAFSTDETHVLTWSADKTARLWDARSGDELATLRHEGPVVGAVFSTDETRVLTWSADKTARLWDAKSGDELATLRHESRVLGAVFSMDETRVLTWSADKTARLWDAKSGDELATLRHEGPVVGAVFSTDETRVLTWSLDATARLWDAKSGDELATLHHEGRVTGAAFSTDETHVLTWSADKTARLWDAKSGDELATLRHEDWVSGAVFSMDETRVLTWSLDGTVRLWDAKSGDELATLRHEGRVSGAVFSTDETRVLTWSADKTARLWDAKSGDELATLRHESWVSGAVFSTDETHVLTWSLDGTVRLWDAKTGDELATLRHEDWVSGAVFSMDETRVLTWSADKTARLWDAKSGDELATLRHEDLVEGAVFSTDETRVLTWSADKTARLWDAKSGDELATLHHEGRVLGAVFSMDETRVLTWSLDGTAPLWPNWRTLDELQDYVSAIVKRLPLSKANRCDAYLDLEGCD